MYVHTAGLSRFHITESMETFVMYGDFVLHLQN